MISKKQKQFIEKLQQKKFRKEFNCFIVEGKKSVLEFLNARFVLEHLFCVEVFSDIEKISEEKITFITPEALKQISLLKNPDDCLAIFKIPVFSEISSENEALTIVLDGVRDPGNLGTIIRLCHWFGLKHLVCSFDTTDCYNPKVVQASMGSLSRVKVIYTDIFQYLKSTEKSIFAATLNGENAFGNPLPKNSVLVLGNEANGISKEILSICENKITIPQFSQSPCESLNVAVAGAILVAGSFRQ